MEEKKYEAGRVEISSAEYRDLVKDMVEAQKDAYEARHSKWQIETENKKLKEELALARKKIEELETLNTKLQSIASLVTKEGI